MTLRVHLDDTGVRHLLREFAARGRRPPLRRIAVIMQASVSRNFQAGGRPHLWPPLKRSTLAARRFGGDRPLQDTGALKKSVNERIHYPDNVEVYSDHDVAPFHQFGTRPYLIRPKSPGGRLFFTVAGDGGSGRNKKGQFTSGKKTAVARGVNHPGLPARPFIIWQDEDVSLVMKTLTDFLLDGR